MSRETKRGRFHQVAAGNADTAETARGILQEGGNAFDAAVAAAFTAMVAEPTLTSAGGGGHLMALPADGPPVVYDFFVDMPGGAADEMDFFPVEVDFGTTQQAFYIGKGSAAVPGNVAGLLAVQRRLGRLPRRIILEPARDAARKGVRLSAIQGSLVEMLAPILTHSESGRRQFAPGGKLLQQGSLYRSHAFAAFLDELSRQGARFLYRGEGARILVDWAAEGGLIVAEDLARYRVRVRRPLKARFADSIILLNPPPAQSGRLIAFTLKMLQTRASPRLKEVALALSETDTYRAAITAGSTTQISILDREGNAASLTTTNGEGCGYFLGELGFMVNNMLGEQDVNPQGFHRHPAGQRLSTMMAPTIAVRKGRPVLVTGSAGSLRIRSAVVQILVRTLLWKQDLETAVESPRLHPEGRDLQVEPGLPEAAIQELAEDFSVKLWRRKSLYFGGAHSVSAQEAIGDSRRNGHGIRFQPAAGQD